MPLKTRFLYPAAVDHDLHSCNRGQRYCSEYVRGYRDVGNDGLEILQIAPDRDDIICAPGEGRVQSRHFEALINSK